MIDNPLYRAALEYHELGLAVVPCCDPGHHVEPPAWHCKQCGPDKRGKVPLVVWKRYQEEVPDMTELREWWLKWPLANVACVMGAVSGCVSFDVDDAAGLHALHELNGGELEVTWRARTGGGGERIFYGWDGALPPPPTHWTSPTKPLHFLSTGFLSVMPPSSHISGNSYEWVTGRAPGEVPLAPISPRLWGEIEARARKTKPGKRGGGKAPLVDMTDDGWRKRARGAARRWQPAVSGESGRDVAYALACALVHGCRQPVDAALAIMLEDWNQRCDPPWPEGELRKKVESAAATGHWEWRGADTYRPVLAPAERVYVAPTAPPAPTPAPIPQVDGAGGAVPGPDPPRQYGRLASSVGRREVEWFQRPWVPARTLTVISGRAGTGKTAMLHRILAQAKRPVLFPGYELDLESMTIPKLASAGVDLDSLLIMDGETLFLARQPKKLVEVLSQHRADLVAFDPLYSYIDDTGEENLNPTIRAALENLCRVCSQLGATAVGTLHPGKKEGNVLRGAAAWRDVPRVVLELRYERSPRERRTIHVEKFPLGSEPPAYEFRIEGPEGEFGAFVLGGALDAADAELSREVPDRLERSKVREARIWLRLVLSDGARPVAWIYAQGRAVDLSGTTLRRAADLDGVVRPAPSRRGPGGEWEWRAPFIWPDLE